MLAPPFIRASQLQPFNRAILHIGASSERELTAVRLSPGLLEKPKSLIAEAPLWRLADAVSQREDIPGFGFLVGELSSLDNIGAFGVKICNCSNLYQALQLFVYDIDSHQSAPPFWLREQEDSVWLCRKGPKGMPSGHWPIEQSVLTMMVQLVSLAAGAAWTPRQAYLQSSHTRGVVQSSSLQGTRLYTSRSYTAIEIPRHLVARPLAKPTTETCTEGVLSTKTEQQGLASNLAQQIHHMLSEHPVTMTTMADYLAIHPRSIQRLLALEGTSFSQLLEKVRIERAMTSLASSDISITQLALELGYSETAHFSRAFKRCNGVSPRGFRTHCASGDSQRA